MIVISDGWVWITPMVTLRKRAGSLVYSLANLAVGRDTTTGRPIFVTGNGRSGTSWIGETLGRADGVLYYREPCHPKRNGFPPAEANRIWCRYLQPQERDDFFEHALGTAFRGHFWRGSGHAFTAYRGRLRQKPRVLVKEVASFMSVEWVAELWNPDILVILRHPGAYAASVRNLNQDPEEVARLRILCRDPALRAGPLDPVLGRLEAVSDPLEAAVAAWGIRTSVVLAILARHPEWTVVQYEDMARDPVAGFRMLYDRFGLAWSHGIETWIRGKTSTESSGAFSTSRISKTRIDAWKLQLTQVEANNIRRVLEPFGLALYDRDEDWVGPYCAEKAGPA